MLLFSHSTRVLDILGAHADVRGWSHCRLDGATKAKDRQDLVDDFNATSTFLFLISTTAGGMGLNLTAATKVVCLFCLFFCVFSQFPLW